MTSAYLDPMVLACPSDDSLDSFEQYITNLLEWSDLRSADWIQIFSLSETHEVLYDTLKYPLWDDLKKIFAKYDITYIQPKDIVTIVDGLLERTIKIQNYLRIADFLAEDIELVPKPKSREQLYLQKLEELITYSSLNCHLNKTEEKYHIVLSREFTSHEIKIAGKIVYIEFTVPNDIEYPIEVYNRFKMCVNFDQLGTNISSIELWKEATEVNGYKQSILFELNGYLKKINSSSIKSIDQISLGGDFIESLKTHNFDSDSTKIEMLLAAIIETALNLNLKSTHALRSGKGGDDPQIESTDGYRAWRKDIDHEYHLHYWKKGNNIILANVVSHNNFNIS